MRPLFLQESISFLQSVCVIIDFSQGLVQNTLELSRLRLNLAFVEEFLLIDQLLLIQIGHALTRIYLLVHDRIGKRGIVEFVVAILTETNQVNHHVLGKFVSIFDCEFGCFIC